MKASERALPADASKLLTTVLRLLLEEVIQELLVVKFHVIRVLPPCPEVETR